MNHYKNVMLLKVLKKFGIVLFIHVAAVVLGGVIHLNCQSVLARNKIPNVRGYTASDGSLTILDSAKVVSFGDAEELLEWMRSYNQSVSNDKNTVLTCRWGEERYRKLQGTYPLIFLSFAKVKATEYPSMEYAIIKIIFEAYEKNSFLLESDVLSKNEKEFFESVKARMNSAVAADAINTLANFLSRYYGRKVIILLDEYDTPMQEAWLSGYWDEAVAFFRSFFNATFKTNPYMERGLITGILLKPEMDAPSPLGSKKPR